MSLGNKIQTAHPQSTLNVVNHPMIFIADFTERTKLLPVKRHVEITSFQQQDPAGTALMDSLIVHNDSQYDVEVVQLDDNIFNNILTKRVHPNQHCEGCFSIIDKQPLQWIAVMELKDCSSNSPYKEEHAFKAKRQIYNVIQDLRTRGIITTERLYGLISWPQVKTSFNSMITGADIIAATRYKKYTGVTFYGSNEAYIINKDEVSPVIVS